MGILGENKKPGSEARLGVYQGPGSGQVRIYGKILDPARVVSRVRLGAYLGGRSMRLCASPHSSTFVLADCHS